MTEEDKAAVAQYCWLKNGADRVRGVGRCMVHTVHAGASVDAVVVLRSRPVEMPAVLVALEFVFYVGRMTAWLLE